MDELQVVFWKKSVPKNYNAPKEHYGYKYSERAGLWRKWLFLVSPAFQT